MLKLKNVTASYGFANVLHNIDLSIEKVAQSWKNSIKRRVEE